MLLLLVANKGLTHSNANLRHGIYLCWSFSNLETAKKHVRQCLFACTKSTGKTTKRLFILYTLYCRCKYGCWAEATSNRQETTKRHKNWKWLGLLLWQVSEIFPAFFSWFSPFVCCIVSGRALRFGWIVQSYCSSLVWQRNHLHQSDYGARRREICDGPSLNVHIILKSRYLSAIDGQYGAAIWLKWF